MSKYDPDPEAAAKTAARRDRSRPDCVVNVAEIEPSEYRMPKGNVGASVRDIGAAVGTKLLGVDLTEIAPGKDSSHLHHHTKKEEFFFVVSGRCRLRLGDKTHELRAGDSVARPANSGVAHQFTNPYEEPCKVLMFGLMEGPGVEDVVDWPELGRFITFTADDQRKIHKKEKA